MKKVDILLALILAVLIGIILAGCCGPRVLNTTVKDSTIYNISYRDTTIGISLAGASASGVLPLELPAELPQETIYSSLRPLYEISGAQALISGLQLSDTSFLSTPLATSRAWVAHSKLFHTLTQADTTISVRLKNALAQIEILKKTTTTIQVPVHYLTWWDKLWIWCGRGAVGLILLYICLRILSAKLGIFKKLLG